MSPKMSGRSFKLSVRKKLIFFVNPFVTDPMPLLSSCYKALISPLVTLLGSGPPRAAQDGGQPQFSGCPCLVSYTSSLPTVKKRSFPKRKEVTALAALPVCVRVTEQVPEAWPCSAQRTGCCSPAACSPWVGGQTRRPAHR